MRLILPVIGLVLIALSVPAAPPTDPVTIPACQNEDGSGQPLPCRWNAAGNGVGRSFIVNYDDTGCVVYYYDDGSINGSVTC